MPGFESDGADRDDDEAHDDQAPAGFEILFPDEPFEVHAGPHYFRSEDGPDGRPRRVAGMRARRVHTSASEFVHGGALLAFADSALTAFAMEAMADDSERVATITVNAEFVAPVRMGAWIECRGEVTKLTRSLAFVRGTMTVGGEAVMTCSTVLRRWRPG